jgi:predicted dehydrogenase
MVRLAIVGVGGYGRQLAELIVRLSERLGCRLVAAADTRLSAVRDRVEGLAGGGVELFDDPAAMFDALRGRCEGVYVATGIGSHAPLAIAAAERGFHVHLEKPPAATVQEVDAMIDAFARCGRLCLVGFHQVHGSCAQWLKGLLAAGRLGRVRTITSRAGWPRDRAYYGRNDWAGHLTGGDAWVLDGPATNALAHQVNNMLYLAAPQPRRYAAPAAVRAELYAAGDVESHDTAAIEIRTAEGAVCYWLGSHCSEGQFGPVIELEAEAGRATWIPGRSAEVTCADGTSERREEGEPRPAMIANFVEAVRRGDGADLRCTLDDARAFTLALDGAHESSRAVHRIPRRYTSEAGEGPRRRTVVAGLDDLINEAARRRCLFADLPQPPGWAVAAEEFDLAGYRRFPSRFRCD